MIARGTPEAEQTLGGQPLGLPVELLGVSRLSSTFGRRMYYAF